LPLASIRILGNGAKVVVELRGTLVAVLPNFIHNGIVAHGYSPINSSGVPITGGSYPFDRMIRDTAPRISAFARCRQFHVSRISI